MWYVRSVLLVLFVMTRVCYGVELMAPHKVCRPKPDRITLWQERLIRATNTKQRFRLVAEVQHMPRIDTDAGVVLNKRLEKLGQWWTFFGARSNTDPLSQGLWVIPVAGQYIGIAGGFKF